MDQDESREIASRGYHLSGKSQKRNPAPSAGRRFNQRQRDRIQELLNKHQPGPDRPRFHSSSKNASIQRKYPSTKGPRGPTHSGLVWKSRNRPPKPIVCPNKWESPQILERWARKQAESKHAEKVREKIRVLRV